MSYKTLLAFAGLAAIAGCASNESGVFFTSPEIRGNMTVQLSPETSLDALAAQLTAGGFRITGINRAEGIVDATTSDVAFLDCGKLRQVKFGNSAVFDGNAPLSVIYNDPDTVDFVTREIAAMASIQVTIDGTSASIAERHQVTVTWRGADGTKLR